MDLTCQYKVGKSRKIVEIGSSSKDKVTYQYELKVVTNSGEFTEDKWKSLVEKQCKELLELDILEELKKYSLNLAWIYSEDEAYKYALNLYSRKIWEDKEWVGYEAFNKIINKNIEYEQMSLI